MPIIAIPIDTTPPDGPSGNGMPIPLRGRGGSWFTAGSPLNRPVTLAELRRQCRLDTSLVPRTVVAQFQDGKPLDLPRDPIISTIDRTGAPVGTYTTRNSGSTTRIVPDRQPIYPVTVTYRAGYAAADGTAAAVPADLKLAILQLAATYYANRESVAEKSMIPIPHTVEAFFARKARTTGVA